MDFVFDPRDLISRPYRTCPSCGQEQFGLLSVHGESFHRKCRDCGHTQGYGLPRLRRKVLYLDQFAISNMMKALNDRVRGHANAVADPFWLELFEALERACKLQLAICPHSGEHRDESLASPFFAALKRMYEQLSHGIAFDSSEQIVNQQVAVAAQAWVRGETPAHDLDPEGVTHGGLHSWKDPYIISVDMQYPAEMVEEIRRRRDEVHEELLKLFEGWRSNPNKSFDYWIELCRSDVGTTILEGYDRYVRRIHEIAASGEPFSFEKVYRSRALRQFEVIVAVLRATAASPDELREMIPGFVRSDALKDCPGERIAALMWAVIGYRAANGQKRPPDRGMVNDIGVVSALLPYCDAMLVDNETRALLDNIPRAHALPFNTRLFSRSNGDELIAYLRHLEQEAPPEIVRSVQDLYGDESLRPYLSMYGERSS